MADLEIDYVIPNEEYEQSQYYSPLATKTNNSNKLPLLHLVHYRMKAALSVGIASLIFAIAICLTTLFVKVFIPTGEDGDIGYDKYTYPAALFCVFFSLLELVFVVFRMYLGLYKPHYSIYTVLFWNIAIIIFGLGTLALYLYFLYRFVVYVSVCVPYLGLVITLIFMECGSLMQLIENKDYFKGKREILAEKSIESTKILHRRLVISMILHILTVVPAVIYVLYRDRIFFYLPLIVFCYCGAVIVLNIFGMFGARQTTEPPQLIAYFIGSLIVSFFGVYMILVVMGDASMYELGFHPIHLSIPLFILTLLAWLFQLTCSHRAWMLIKYKQELRKNLHVRYSSVDSLMVSGSNEYDHTPWSEINSPTSSSFENSPYLSSRDNLDLEKAKRRYKAHNLSLSIQDTRMTDTLTSDDDSSDIMGDTRRSDDSTSFSGSQSAAFSLDEVMKYF